MTALPRPETRHLRHWPPGQSPHLTLPGTHLFHNLEVSAARYPDKPAFIFYGHEVTYARLAREAEHVAGWLQHEAGVRRGDRVLLDLQNSPQWVIACYAILRADAVVVPVNPMSKVEELRHYVHDAQCRVAFVAQDVLPHIEPLLGSGGLDRIVVATYADHLGPANDLEPPAFVAAARAPMPSGGRSLVAWADVLAAAHVPQPHRAGPDDLAIMPYTSGTTGAPKGCMHTHGSVMSTAVGGAQWFGRTQDSVSLSVLPLFHATGMIGGMHSVIWCGGTGVLMARWDREMAARLIERHRIVSWQAIATMVIDFLANPRLQEHDLSSLQFMRGGGAAMPDAVHAQLKAVTGVDYVEGYGMSETIAATHINPPHRPKPQCLGIPVYDVDARLMGLDGGPVADGEAGEVVVDGPQVMQGYWRNEAATKDAFVEIDGKRFLRTGDIARVDEDGYFFMTDRLKRMINAAGFKVWPAEVESMIYRHPAVQEACVIAARDPRRGETVKAYVVRREGTDVDADALMAWCHEHMAAYKVPRIVEFVDSLPKGGSGKVLWRQLQEREDGR